MTFDAEFVPGSGTDLELVRKAQQLRRSDPEQGFNTLFNLAGRGSPHGMHQLAWCYVVGCGTAVDFLQAEKWYRRAFEAGDEEVRRRAIYGLGWIYSKQKNYGKAREIYTAGAEIDYAPALYHLGRLYQKARGVKKDLHKARVFLERAAAQRHCLARRDLALLLMSGRCGVRHIPRGVRLFIRNLRDLRARFAEDPDFMDGKEDIATL